MIIDFERVYTVEDFLALGPDPTGYLIELRDGRIVVSPGHRPLHQAARAGFMLQTYEAKLRTALDILPMTVRVSADSARTPSLSVFRNPPTHSPDDRIIEAADLVAVVEIVIPDARKHDQADIAQLYAEAGISWYVELRNGPGGWRGEVQHLHENAYVPDNADHAHNLFLPFLNVNLNTADARLRPREGGLADRIL